MTAVVARNKACLVDVLKHHLARVVVGSDVLEDRKYYHSAHHMLGIGAFKPVPPYIINLSDLSPELIKELHSLDNKDRRFVLKQEVGRIFEDINPELYHNSISRVLRVKLQ